MDAKSKSGKKSPTNSEGSGGSGKKEFILSIRDKGDLKTQFFVDGSKHFYTIPQSELKELLVTHMAEKMLSKIKM